MIWSGAFHRNTVYTKARSRSGRRGDCATGYAKMRANSRSGVYKWSYTSIGGFYGWSRSGISQGEKLHALKRALGVQG